MSKQSVEGRRSEIIKISKEINPKEQERAEDHHREVLARTMVTADNLLELGRLFKAIRDEKLYKLLGADSFGEYIAYPEISFGRSTIYSFIHVYELYVLKLGFESRTLSNIGHRKLQIIAPIIKSHVASALEIDEWIKMAELLSESDLINEVRRVQGKPEMTPKPKERESVYPFSFDDYKSFVINSPCCVCGNSPPSEPAHFPKTRGAGAKDTDIIPLCHSCHLGDYHNDPYDFTWLHLYKISKYFYDTFLKAFEVIRRKACQNL